MSLINVSFSVWFAIVIFGNFIRFPYYKDHYANAVKVSNKNFSEYLIMTFIAFGFILVPLVWFVLDLFKDFNRPHSLTVLCLGAATSPVSMWLFYRSHFDLQKQWSPSLEIRENHELVTSGIYKYTRNPMYLAVLIWSLGQALVLPNFMAGLAAFVSLVPLFVFRLPREEKMMHRHFGESYVRYKNETSRLVPFLF
jgi:protein-S-isoprenylcysteine O-methyltransferase Ste14